MGGGNWPSGTASISNIARERKALNESNMVLTGLISEGQLTLFVSLFQEPV